MRTSILLPLLFLTLNHGTATSRAVSPPLSFTATDNPTADLSSPPSSSLGPTPLPRPFGCNGLHSLCTVPYSHITFIGANHSPLWRASTSPAKSLRKRPFQHLSARAQLDAGVRALAAVIGKRKGRLIACHPGYERCKDVDGKAKVLLGEWLHEVRMWVARPENRHEVVTIILDNPDDGSVEYGDIDEVVREAGLERYLFEALGRERVVALPTLGEMLDRGQNVVLFVERSPSFLSQHDHAPDYMLDKDTYFFVTSPFQEDILFNTSVAVVPDRRIYGTHKVAEHQMGIAYHTAFKTDKKPQYFVEENRNEEPEDESGFWDGDGEANDEEFLYRKSKGSEDSEALVKYVNSAGSVLSHVQRWKERYRKPMNIILLNYVELADAKHLFRLINDGAYWGLVKPAKKTLKWGDKSEYDEPVVTFEDFDNDDDWGWD